MLDKDNLQEIQYPDSWANNMRHIIDTSLRFDCVKSFKAEITTNADHNVLVIKYAFDNAKDKDAQIGLIEDICHRRSTKEVCCQFNDYFDTAVTGSISIKRVQNQ